MRVKLYEADRKWLVEEIRRAVTEALTVDVQWEKLRDEKTGLPLSPPERRAEKVFLPAFFCQLLPFYEGAMRGLQEDVNKSNNRGLETAEKVDTIGRTLLGLEQGMRSIARFSALIKQELLERSAAALPPAAGGKETILLESDPL